LAGRRAVGLRLNGALDLRLIQRFCAESRRTRSSTINAAFEGTLDRPDHWTRHIENASARAADFPPGLAPSRATCFRMRRACFLENMSRNPEEARCIFPEA